MNSEIQMITVMKRKLMIIIVLVLPVLVASAQKPDTAQILVHYKFSHVRDTNNPTHPYTESMVLFVGKASSSFKSYNSTILSV